MCKPIESGFCIVVYDFMAYVVPFKTLSIGYAMDSIPQYVVELPNGTQEQFNETDLFIDKAKADKQCEKMNLRMKEYRESWLSEGLPAIRRFERLGF